MVEVKKLTTFYDFDIPRCAKTEGFSILSMPARRVEALSLRRRANLLLAKWCLEVVAWFARLLSESRGRGVDPRLVRGSFLDRNRNFSVQT